MILIILAVACLVLFVNMTFFKEGPEDAVVVTHEALPSSEEVEEDMEVEVLPEASEEEIVEEPVVEATPAPIENPYKEYFLQNSDMAGWLLIPGTNVDYPVMWTPRDEEYYLYRGFNKQKDLNGCLILDTDSCVDPITTNLIIHGHKMKNGDMFGKLFDYEDPAYCEDHKEMYLYTEDRLRKYEVISVFYSQVYKKSDTVFKFYKFFQAHSKEEFENFYNNIKKMSLYDTKVTAEYGDRFITLSTCSYHVENGRFVVVAKEVECDETYLPFGEQ